MTITLTYNQFINHHILIDSIRGDHILIFTNYGKITKIADIIDFLKKNLNNINPKIIETDLSKPFREPLNLNKNFWNTGNNYFINCIKYGFRKNVMNYMNSNKYIKNIKKPILFTKDYYLSLDKMSDDEIKLFLEKNRIKVTKNSKGEYCLIHGVHRVCCMINRLINNKPYININIKTKDSNYLSFIKKIR